MTSISKMKKHPIDELFHQKLEKHETNVNSDLRARFLAQLEEKEKPAAIPFRWYYAAAAVLFLGISFGVYFLQSDQDTLAQQNQAGVPDSVNKSVAASSRIPEEETQLPVKETELAVKMPQTKEKANLRVKENTAVKTIVNTLAEPAVKSQIILDEPIPDQLTLALQEAQNKKNAAEQDIPGNKTLFRKSAGETIIILTDDFEQPEQIYLPELNSDSPLTLAEAEYEAERKMDENKPVFSKFLAEIKSLKHGEKVDFNSLVAQVDNEQGFDEETLLGHEAEELRQKINWFKGKFAKP